MNSKSISVIVIALLMAVACAKDSDESPQSSTVVTTKNAVGSFKYNPAADPEKSLAQALSAAKNADTLLLIVFGSEWCPDCRSFNTKLALPPLSDTISEHYTVMHVDIGRWDRNMAFANKFDEPAANGIPSVAILDNNGKLLHVTKGGEFATARHAEVGGLNDYIKGKALEFRSAH